MNRILQTVSNGEFTETEYAIPSLTSDEIRVRSVMTGVCRSDIDMMNGDFGPLPLHMQGHEGLGCVIGIGANITDVNVGDYVATRGEPAYADYYNVRHREYVPVPEAHPRYILEPVACGINVIHQPLREIAERAGPGQRLLILGSGFLAWIAYNTIKLNHLDFEIDGLWYGLGVGLAVLSVSFANIIFKSDWEIISSRIRDDMKYDLMQSSNDDEWDEIE